MTEPVWRDPAVAAGIARQLGVLDRLLEEGAELVGWKVGVGAPAAMSAAGIDAPLVGYLTSATVVPDGATVSIEGWQRPVLEPELAVRVAADVPTGSDRAAVVGAIAGVRPAIELADVDTPLDDLDAVVAGDIFHRNVVLAPTGAERAGADPTGLRIRVDDRGEQVAATDVPTELTGELVSLVAHVADWLEAAGRCLSAGEVVICGSTVPLVPLAPGARIRYRCEPLGELVVGIDATPQ